MTPRPPHTHSGRMQRPHTHQPSHLRSDPEPCTSERPSKQVSEQASEQASHRAIEQASKPALRGASEPARVPAGGTHLPGVEGQKSDDISGPHGCEGLPHEGQRDVDERHREEEVVERRLLPLAAVARAQRGDGWREKGGGGGGEDGRGGAGGGACAERNHTHGHLCNGRTKAFGRRSIDVSCTEPLFSSQLAPSHTAVPLVHRTILNSPRISSLPT